jgi:hypothetical protein
MHCFFGPGLFIFLFSSDQPTRAMLLSPAGPPPPCDSFCSRAARRPPTARHVATRSSRHRASRAAAAAGLSPTPPIPFSSYRSEQPFIADGAYTLASTPTIAVFIGKSSWSRAVPTASPRRPPLPASSTGEHPSPPLLLVQLYPDHFLPHCSLPVRRTEAGARRCRSHCRASFGAPPRLPPLPRRCGRIPSAWWSPRSRTHRTSLAGAFPRHRNVGQLTRRRRGPLSGEHLGP